MGRNKITFEQYEITKEGKVISPSGKELKPRITQRGYYRVGINDKDYYIHRLVAEKYLPNPERKPYIDHINCDKSDNRVENLRWVTHTENMNNPITRKNISQIMVGKKRTYKSIEKQRKTIIEKYGIKVIQLDKNNNYINTYDSISAAAIDNNIPQQNIGECIKMKRKTAGGYRWIKKN